MFLSMFLLLILRLDSTRDLSLYWWRERMGHAHTHKESDKEKELNSDEPVHYLDGWPQ